jgi:hypothetical protein
MRLESIDEIRAQGVAVYPHVVEKAHLLDVGAFVVPKWARWIAANESGAVWAYGEKPFTSSIAKWWILRHATMALYLDTIDMTGIDWRRTLTAVNILSEGTSSLAVGTVRPALQASAV